MKEGSEGRKEESEGRKTVKEGSEGMGCRDKKEGKKEGRKEGGREGKPEGKTEGRREGGGGGMAEGRKIRGSPSKARGTSRRQSHDWQDMGPAATHSQGHRIRQGQNQDPALGQNQDVGKKWGKDQPQAHPHIDSTHLVIP